MPRHTQLNVREAVDEFVTRMQINVILLMVWRLVLKVLSIQVQELTQSVFV